MKVSYQRLLEVCFCQRNVSSSQIILYPNAINFGTILKYLILCATISGFSQYTLRSSGVRRHLKWSLNKNLGKRAYDLEHQTCQRIYTGHFVIKIFWITDRRYWQTYITVKCKISPSHFLWNCFVAPPSPPISEQVKFVEWSPPTTWFFLKGYHW